jgi:hypothetical protein
VLELHRAGTVTGPDFLVGGPELPTAAEPASGMVSLNSGGLFAAARTAKEIVDRIDRATRNAMSDPKWEQQSIAAGLELAVDASSDPMRDHSHQPHADAAGDHPERSRYADGTPGGAIRCAIAPCILAAQPWRSGQWPQQRGSMRREDHECAYGADPHPGRTFMSHFKRRGARALARPRRWRWTDQPPRSARARFSRSRAR